MEIYRISLHEPCKDRTYEAFGVLSPQWGLLWEKKNDINYHFLMTGSMGGTKDL